MYQKFVILIIIEILKIIEIQHKINRSYCKCMKYNNVKIFQVRKILVHIKEVMKINF